MITKLKRIILTVAAIAALGAPALLPTVAYAQDEIKSGVNCADQLEIPTDGAGCGEVTTEGATGIQDLVRKVINIFSVIVGIIAVIMIIVGGLKYITSGGESGNVSGAKNTIIYAIVGLIIVALAQFIVRFVLGNTNQIGNGA